MEGLRRRGPVVAAPRPTRRWMTPIRAWAPAAWAPAASGPVAPPAGVPRAEEAQAVAEAGEPRVGGPAARHVRAQATYRPAVRPATRARNASAVFARRRPARPDVAFSRAPCACATPTLTAPTGSAYPERRRRRARPALTSFAPRDAPQIRAPRASAAARTDTARSFRAPRDSCARPVGRARRPEPRSTPTAARHRRVPPTAGPAQWRTRTASLGPRMGPMSTAARPTPATPAPGLVAPTRPAARPAT